MHETTARLIAARQDACEVLASTDALARMDWPPKATAHRNALLDLIQALDDVMHIDRYPVNPDAPEEGTDIRAIFSVDADSLVIDPSLPPAEYHRRYQARFASR